MTAAFAFVRAPITTLILAAVFLVGVATLAVLPPFEGFDEYAHYSSVQQIADTGEIPFYGGARVSTDIEAYAGPRSYATGAGAFSDTGHPTYRGYAQSGGRLPAHVERKFAPGAQINWQAQHPPLFYAALAPVYHATRTMDWVSHFFWLRLASWTLAFAGLAIGVIATVRLAGSEAPAMGPIMAGFPFLVPEFFPEMARLGNDSLCLLLAGAAWALVLALLTERGGVRSAIGLAIVLGLGLLTKAFFLALAAGFCSILAWRWLAARKMSALRDLLIVGLGTAAIGLWWYVRNALLFGAFTGANDFLQSGADFDLWGGLAHNFSFARLLNGVAVMAASFSWAGSWSLVRAPEILIFIPLALVAVTLGAWAWRLRHGRLLDWAPALILAPLIAGLFFHLFHNLAMAHAQAGTPAWYLHIAAAPIAYAMALGWRRPRLCGALAAASGLGGMALLALQASLFSGCATKGADKHYDYAGAACFIDGRALGAITAPGVAAGAVVLALAVLGLAGWRSLQRQGA